MKIKKWLTLLCFIIIVAILPCTSLSVSAANYIIAKSRTKLVDCIYTQLLDHKSDFEIKYYGNYEELDIKAIINKAYEIDDPDIAYDYDYLKWNINGYKYSTSYTSKEAHLKFHFTYLDTKTQQKKVDKAIKSIMKELKLSKKSDLNKVKIIHDYIVNTFTYDESQSKYSVYAGLLSKQHATVCQGYALMTYRMLKEAGINSIIVDYY